MSAIAGYGGSIYYSLNQASVALPANDQLTDSGDHTTYVEATASHRYWDDTAVPTVQISTNGGSTWTTQASNLYTVQYVGGKIIWNSAQSSGTLTRISTGGKYWAYSTFALGTDWELDGKPDILDVTVLGGGRAKQFIPGLFTGKFTMKAFWIDNTFQNNIATGFKLIFSGTPNGTNRYEAYVYTTMDKIMDAVAKTIDEQMEFQVTAAWYYN